MPAQGCWHGTRKHPKDLSRAGPSTIEVDALVTVGVDGDDDSQVGKEHRHQHGQGVERGFEFEFLVEGEFDLLAGAGPEGGEHVLVEAALVDVTQAAIFGIVAGVGGVTGERVEDAAQETAARAVPGVNAVDIVMAGRRDDRPEIVGGVLEPDPEIGAAARDDRAEVVFVGHKHKRFCRHYCYLYAVG